MTIAFANPDALYLLLLLPAAAALFVWRGRARRAALQRLGNSDLLRRLTPGASRRRRIVKAGLWLTAAGMLMLALARPMWGVDVEVVETQGAAVMLVLDVSQSMLAQDIPPSRLERAKLAVRDLIERLAGNEIGLVLFAGEALIQFPLTTDALSVQSFVSAASTQSISQQGTDLDGALRLAAAALDQPRPTTRSIIVLSDGEDHQGDPVEAAGSAASAGITVHMIGYGDLVGAPIPVLDDDGRVAGYKTSADGNLVLTALNEETLRAAAERGGGLYQRATAQGDEGDAIAAAILAARSGALENRTAVRGVERFGVFLLLAAAALGLEMALSEAGRRAA
jgi:Ca-activated chloride channel family protein